MIIYRRQPQGVGVIESGRIRSTDNRSDDSAKDDFDVLCYEAHVNIDDDKKDGSNEGAEEPTDTGFCVLERKNNPGPKHDGQNAESDDHPSFG